MASLGSCFSGSRNFFSTKKATEVTWLVLTENLVWTSEEHRVQQLWEHYKNQIFVEGKTFLFLNWASFMVSRVTSEKKNLTNPNFGQRIKETNKTPFLYISLISQ